MAKKISFELKEKLVQLAGSCFWYWGSFSSFLDSCGVNQDTQSRYPKGAYTKYEVMRNILNYLEETKKVDVINNIISGFFRLNNPLDTENINIEKAKKLLKEFKELVGNDPIEKEIERREQEKKREVSKNIIEQVQVKEEKIKSLKGRFLQLFSSQNFTPQQRGYELEKLFFELLELEEFEFTLPFKSEGEQIDGHFKYEKFDYLVEIKWIAENAKQKDLSIFDGKIKGKAQSTRGLFFAVNGFDDNVINKYSGDSPRIILMSGEDFMYILEKRTSFYDAMKVKIDSLVRYGDINYSLRKSL